MGWSVQESNDMSLIDYGLETFNYADVTERNSKTKEKVNLLIEKFQIEIVSLEDVFLQYYYDPKTKSQKPRSVEGFKTLCKLMGVIEVSLFEKNMLYIPWKASEWRSTVGIKGRDRETQKANAILHIKEKYGLDISDDNICEAICISEATCKRVNKTYKGKV
jgi:Holliday junction resolvasome RuvABC endonuclease subunit